MPASSVVPNPSEMPLRLALTLKEALGRLAPLKMGDRKLPFGATWGPNAVPPPS